MVIFGAKSATFAAVGEGFTASWVASTGTAANSNFGKATAVDASEAIEVPLGAKVILTYADPDSLYAKVSVKLSAAADNTGAWTETGAVANDTQTVYVTNTAKSVNLGYFTMAETTTSATPTINQADTRFKIAVGGVLTAYTLSAETLEGEEYVYDGYAYSFAGTEITVKGITGTNPGAAKHSVLTPTGCTIVVDGTNVDANGLIGADAKTSYNIVILPTASGTIRIIAGDWT